MDETPSALCTDPLWDPERDHVWRPVLPGFSSTLAAPENVFREFEINMCSQNAQPAQVKLLITDACLQLVFSNDFQKTFHSDK